MKNTLHSISDICKKLSYILTNEQKTYGIIVIILSFMTAGFELIGVSVIVPLVNALLEPTKITKSRYIGMGLNMLAISDESDIIITVIVGVIIIYIIKNVFFFFNTWVRLKYSCKIQRECSIKMFDSYLARQYSYFLDHNVNEMLQGSVGDISGLYAMISGLLQMLTQSVIIILIVSYMMYTDWQLAVAVVCSAGLCLLLIIMVLKSKMKDAGIGIRKYAILVNKVLLEAFNGIKEVLVMKRQKYYLNEYEKVIKKKQRYQIIQGIGAEVPAYLIEAICISGIMGILCFKMLNTSDKGTFVATLAAFAVGVFRILPGLGKISSSINSIISYIPNLNAIYDNIRYANEFEATSKTNTNQFYEESTSNDFNVINIRNVSFSYNPKNIGMVLNNIDLDIKKGESIAFVGETGAGKSTLADIILGLLIPTQGSVLIDGVDIRNIPNTWARIMAFVPQSIYLSDNTIRANVAFGIEDKDIDDQKVREALDEANILSFVDSLPDGANTEIGDRGVRLSGGQCQRIGIARALYRKPKVLILDEATSALDNDTEHIVMKAIEKLQGKMTLIIIAHRLTTIKKCDRIYEIKQGHIYSRTYEELVP